MKELLLVFFGGGVGCVIRYALSVWLKPFAAWWHGLPIHTLAANMAGCLLIGMLMGVCSSHHNQWVPLLLVTGLCGGFTTFSTFSWECVSMLRDGQWLLAVLYVALSLLVCVGLAAVGYYIVAK